MTDRKLESRILYFMVFILIGILLTMIFGMSISLINFNVDKDLLSPLSTFLGALLGAGVSGGIAIYVMHRDIASRSEEKKKEQNDNFKKSFELISMWSRTYLEGLNIMQVAVMLEEQVNKDFLERELSGIELCKSTLDKINDDYIPQQVYKDFLDMKAHMDFTFHQFKDYATSLNSVMLHYKKQELEKWIRDSSIEQVSRYNNHLKVLRDYSIELDS